MGLQQRTDSECSHMEQLVQQLVNGILIGLVYALLAIGLTLIWGVMNVLNFAHGEFLMIGMFISYWLYVLAGVDPLFSIPINAVALFLLGMFIYRFIVSKVMRGPALAQLVVTFGISIFLANFAALIWTPNFPIHRAHTIIRHLGHFRNKTKHSQVCQLDRQHRHLFRGLLVPAKYPYRQGYSGRGNGS